MKRMASPPVCLVVDPQITTFDPVHYSLATADYSRLTTHYSLLTTHDLLLTTHYSLLTTRHWLVSYTHDSLPTTHFTLHCTHCCPLLTTHPLYAQVNRNHKARRRDTGRVGTRYLVLSLSRSRQTKSQLPFQPEPTPPFLVRYYCDCFREDPGYGPLVADYWLLTTGY